MKKYFKLDDIRVTVCVRKELSQERVRMFEDYYTSEMQSKIPPIQIDQNGNLIDGRHRLLALKNLDVVGVDCEVVTCNDKFDLTIAAMKANMGGSKELSMADIRKNIIDLLELKYSRKKIVKSLPFPKDMVAKLYRDAHGHWYSMRIRAAIHISSDGKISLEEACARYDVPVAAAKKEINRRKSKESLETSVQNLGMVKAVITKRYYMLTKKNSVYINKLVEQYEQSEIQDDTLTEAMAHIDHQIRIHDSAMKDWNERLKIMITTRRPLPKKMSPKKLLDELEEED